jgi:hypothetical protein
MKLKQKCSIMTGQIELAKNQNNAVPQQTLNMRNQLKQDIENILSAECVMCGDLMIQQIDKKFSSTNEKW